jgi:hypothetical protein
MAEWVQNNVAMNQQLMTKLQNKIDSIQEKS